MKSYLEKFSEENKKYTEYVDFQAFNRAFNISLKYKYIYVVTSKVGNSSIKTTLQRMELEDPDYYMDKFEEVHDRSYSPLLMPLQVGNFQKILDRQDFLRFCFVRNPYTRLLSAYLDRIAGNKPQKNKVLIQLGYDPSNIEREITFEQFVKAVIAQPISFMDQHWRTQYYQTFQNLIKYDFVGRLESFDEDLMKIMKKINPDYEKYISIEKRHHTGASRMISDYYTKELRDLVYSKYKIDFDFFGYDSSIPEISEEKAKDISDKIVEITRERIEKIEKKLNNRKKEVLLKIIYNFISPKKLEKFLNNKYVRFIRSFWRKK